MPKHTPTLLASEPDTALLEKLAVTERIALATVIAVVALNLAGWFIPLAGRLFGGGWRLMSAESLLFVLLSALSLHFLAPLRSRRMRQAGLLLAALVILLGAAIVAEHLLHLSLGIDVPLPSSAGARLPFAARMPLQCANCFALLGLTTMFLGARKRAAILAADLLTCGLVLLVLILASGQLIDMMHIFGPPANFRSSAQGMVCLLLLTAVIFFRRARKGMFSTLVGHGTGSRLARALSPILLALPYLREATRARFIGWNRMPPYYATAILASLAMVVAMALLLYLARRINRMEVEIHGLSLRDELTGLYNLRGFRLLAEQALRMAHRSRDSFSILFIDFDDLKQINDEFGHPAGSTCLVETAEILKSAFRETDVLGRIGGDEFAVAGQFTQPGILLAARHLRDLVTRRNAEEGRQVALGFSIGHVTSEAGARESLDGLLAKADRAMYEEKRRRKVLVN